MANKTLPAKSGEFFKVSPFRIYIPGHDGPAVDDANNVRMSIESNAREPEYSLVTSMRIDGNQEPIKLIKVPCEASDPFAWEHKGKVFRVETLFGRHRIRGARMIILERGIDPSDEDHEGFVLMRSEVISRMDDETQARLIIAENHARRSIDPIAQAEDLIRYEDMGLSIQQIAEMIGETSASIRNKKRLASLAPDIQDKVRSGEIGRAAGYEVAKLDDHDDQRLAVLEGADGTHPEAIEAVDNVKAANAAMESTSGDRVEIQTQDAPPTPKIAKPKKRDLIELRDAFEGVEPRLAAVLSWALGEISEDERDLNLYDDQSIEPAYKNVVRDNRQADIDAKAKAKSEKAARKAEKAEKATKKKAPPRMEVSAEQEDRFATPPVCATTENLGGVMTM